MRYSDLVQFEPIQSVVRLKDADKATEARRLASTFVISDRMGPLLANVLIPQLQFERAADNKGVLIVGNYGTGKSHLMSLISAVAEHPDALADLSNDDVRAAAAQIAGRFKVLRVELGSSESTLRNIVVRELEEALAGWNIDFSFPPATEITNNKDAIIEAMGLFQERYPEQGLLLVIDELLDFIRARNDQEKILDLGFLRELGEVVADTRFRFMAGLQETLFDSPRFQFIAESLRRVKDRFEQITIGREDIAFVVANRLLKKTPQQMQWIENHLQQFTPLYGGMAERLGEYAELFPIHPAYVSTFEKVYVAEKREVLKTYSDAIASMLDEEVPADQPGLVSYDHYWRILASNPSMRTYPEVAEVLDKEAVVEGRIDHAFPRQNLKPMAIRIIRALGVHRLTTDDINAPLGVTPEELRDDLCLYVQTPAVNRAELLTDSVRVALKLIIQTVSGQYVTHNTLNDQFYLDVKKDTDYETILTEKGETLSDDELNRYFFEVLSQLLEYDTSRTHVPGHRIWEYEVPWESRRVNRLGYLFLGAMDERETAKPPRDFYVYFLQPYLEREPHDDERADEVIFRLTKLPAEFDQLMRRYAGARAMELTSAAHREQFRMKANEAGKILSRWLSEHFADLLEVRHQAKTESGRQALAGASSTAGKGLADVLRTIAAAKLAPEFEERYPDYPAFTKLQIPITASARPGTAMEGINVIAGRQRTTQGTAVLEALGLLDTAGVLRPTESRYAKTLLDKLQAKPDGHVVNRGEVIEAVAPGLTPVERDLDFRMEPEWIGVLLAALVHGGHIVLVLPKETLDASGIEKAATMAIQDFANFRHFTRPKAAPVAVWEEIFSVLGLQAARVRDEKTRAQAVTELVDAVARERDRIAKLEKRIGQDLRVWHEAVITDNFTLIGERGAIVGSDIPDDVLTSTNLRAGLRGYKQFIDEISKFNTPGKLNNLKLGSSNVIEAKGDQATVQRIERLLDIVAQLQSLTDYLATAEAAMPSDSSWLDSATQAKTRVIGAVRRFGAGAEEIDLSALRLELESLKQAYAKEYAMLHREARLTQDEDKRRVKLYDDQRLKALKTLADLDLVNVPDLAGWQKAATNLQVCTTFTSATLEHSPLCECGFRPSVGKPAMSAAQRLNELEGRLDTILSNWRRALRTNLETSTAQTSLANMTAVERAPVDAFLRQTDDDPAIPNGFVKAAAAALRGITAVELAADALLSALIAGGFPCTVDDLKGRFNEFVNSAMHGRHAGTTRLTITGEIS